MTIDGVTYAAGEAVYSTGPIQLVDENTGKTYTAIGIGIGESEITFGRYGNGNIVGYAFVDEMPPAGAALTIPNDIVPISNSGIRYDTLADGYVPPVTFSFGGETYTATGADFTDEELEALAGVDWDDAFTTGYFFNPVGPGNEIVLRLYTALSGDRALTDKVLDITFTDGDSTFTLRDFFNGTGTTPFANAAEAGDFAVNMLATIDPTRFTPVDTTPETPDTGRRLTVDGQVDGDTVYELHADARAESVYSLASGLLSATEGILPEDWDLEDYVGFVLGMNGLGGLVGTPEWDEFAAQLAGLDGTADLSSLDYSMFDVYASEPAGDLLAVVIDEAIALQSVTEHLLGEFEENGTFTLDHGTFEAAYLEVAEPSATAIQRRSLGASVAGGALTYSAISHVFVEGSIATGGGAAAGAGGSALLGVSAATLATVGAVVLVGAAVGVGIAFALGWRPFKDRNKDNIIEPDTPGGAPAPGTNGAQLVEIQLKEAVHSMLLNGDVDGAVNLLYSADGDGVSRENLADVINALPPELAEQVRTEIISRVQTGTNNATDYYTALTQGRTYSGLEDFVFTDTWYLRGAMEGLGYVEPPRDAPSAQLMLQQPGVAERLAALPPESRGVLIGLWIRDVSGEDPNTYQIYYGSQDTLFERRNFFSETMGLLKTADPEGYSAALSALYESAPDEFQFMIETLWQSRLPGDNTLMTDMMDALTTVQQAEFLGRVTGIDDRGLLAEELLFGVDPQGGPSIGKGLFGLTTSRTALIRYLDSPVTGEDVLASARVSEDVYDNLVVSKEVEIAAGVYVPAPTVDRAGIDTIVVYAEGEDIEAGYYHVGLVEEDGVVEYRLINENGAVISDYVVEPPTDDLATGIWQISHIDHGRSLLGGLARFRRLAFSTRNLRLLGGTNGVPGTTTGRYVGHRGSTLQGLWNNRFVTQRPITTTIANEAFNNQTPATISAFGPDGELLQTVEGLAFLLGIAESELTPEVIAALTPLVTDDAVLEQEFNDFLNSGLFSAEALLNTVRGEEYLGKLGVRGWMRQTLLKAKNKNLGLLTQDQVDGYSAEVDEIERLVGAGQFDQAFAKFARLILEGNKIDMAANYMANNPGMSAEDALAAVAPIFEPYEALSDIELVAVSLYAGLDQGGYSGPNVGQYGFLFEGLNNTMFSGTVSERVELGAYSAVLHRALAKIAGFTDDVLPLLNQVVGGTYGDLSSEEDPHLGPVHEVTRGLKIDDPALLEYWSNLEVGDLWNGDHRFHSNTGGPELLSNWQDSNVVIKIRSDKISLVSPLAMSGERLREMTLSAGYTLVLAEKPTLTEDGKLILVLTTAEEAVANANLPDAPPTTATTPEVDSDYALASLDILLDQVLADPEVSQAFKDLLLGLNRSTVRAMVNFLMIYQDSPAIAGHLDEFANSPQGQQVLQFILDNAGAFGLNLDQTNFVADLLGVQPATMPPATPAPEDPSNLIGDTPQEWLFYFIQTQSEYFQPLNSLMPSNSTGGHDTPDFISVGLTLNNLVGMAGVDQNFRRLLIGWLQGFNPAEQQQLLAAAQNNYDPGLNASPEALAFVQAVFNGQTPGGPGTIPILPPGPGSNSGPI
ncbi:MAG: hypothetical protein AAFN94_12285 [Pseudomonadota bacterium]